MRYPTRRIDQQKPARPAVALMVSLALIASTGLLGATDSKSGQQIVDRHLEAMGGKKLVMKRHDVVYKGQFEVQGFSGPFEIHRSDGKMLFTVELEGLGTLSQGYDGTVGWEMGQAGPEVLEGGRLENLTRQIDPRHELRGAPFYESIESVGTQELDGETLDKVKLVSTSGEEIFELYDPVSGLRRANISTTQTPVGEQELTLIFKDYEDHDGLMVAKTIIQRVAGQEIVRRVESVEFRSSSADVFALPAEIADLVE